MYRIFGELHITALIQANSHSSRNFASVVASTSVKLPKKPLSAYNLFVKAKFQKGLSATGQFADISKQWKTISEVEKKKFMNEASKLQKEAAETFNKLSKNKQQQQLEEASQARSDKKNSRRLAAYRKFRKETNHPVRPSNAFLLFKLEHYPATSKQDIYDTSTKAAEEYKKLSDEEKKPYQDKYNQQREVYKVELEKWNDVHGEAYGELKKKYAGPRKVAAKSSRRKKSMGLASRLKKRSSKRKVAPKRKMGVKAAATRRR